MHLCGEFTAQTMFTKGGTAMYEHQPMNLADRADPAVIAALAHRCPMCDVAVGVDCRSIINHRPLPGRIIHFCRLETE